MKLTPEIRKFIYDNALLSSRELSGLIEEKFGIKIGHNAVNVQLQKARAELQANNDAKAEAVRAKILDDGGFQGKYLEYLNNNIVSLHGLLKNADHIKIESTRDYVAVSHAFVKSLSTVMEFVKPDPEGQKAVGHEDWVELRSAILEAVDDQPSAREALVAALEKRRSIDQNVTGER